jgi:hypothetical protein
MRPKKPEAKRSGDLFRARLDQIINLKHERAQLSSKIDWDAASFSQNVLNVPVRAEHDTGKTTNAGRKPPAE